MQNVMNLRCLPRPGLLVSVRNADEALAALAGGADVIDVKEPARGPLGAADPATIADVVRAVAGRVPVTAAAGELVDLCTPGTPTFDGVALVKIGLAGCANRDGWRTELRWKAEGLARGVRVAAVAYADWQAAGAPRPEAVLTAAIELGCAALLVDTWDKSAGGLFDLWSSDDLGTIVGLAREQGLMVALAGSLSSKDIREAASLGADLIAVRGAACEGGREGVVSSDCVAAICEVLAAERPFGTRHCR